MLKALQSFNKSTDVDPCLNLVNALDPVIGNPICHKLGLEKVCNQCIFNYKSVGNTMHMLNRK